VIDQDPVGDLLEADVAERRSPLGRAARSGAAYVALGAVQKGLPLLALPLFAKALSPNEYGAVALLVAIAAVLGALLSLGLEAAVIRTSIRLASAPVERARFVNAIGLFSITVPLTAALVGAVLLVTSRSLPSELGPGIVLIAFAAVALQTTVTTFLGALFRAEERLLPFAIVTCVQAIGGTALSLVLVLGAGAGVSGWFAGSLSGSAAAVVAGLALLRHRWSLDISWGYIRASLVFGLPLLPHAMSHWALNLSDRLVLGGIAGPESVGIYNVAYQLAASVSLLAVAVHQGVMPLYAEASSKAELRAHLRDLATYQVHLIAVAGAAVALLGPTVVVLFFPASYRDAAQLIPLITLGYVFFGLYLVPADSISLLLGKTRWLWVPSSLAAATNIILNLLLVPSLGATAAALDTAIAYGVLLAGVSLYRRRLQGATIGYDLARMAAGLGVAAGVTGLAMVMAPNPASADGLAVRIGGLAFIGGILLVAHRTIWREPRGGQPNGRVLGPSLGRQASEPGGKATISA
jgi:O-antigen/teichoic acid export membrane protein